MSAFQIGEVVRLRKGRSDDGQTPSYWDGAHVEVVLVYPDITTGHRWYKVRHMTRNAVCEFREYEIDLRCVKRQPS